MLRPLSVSLALVAILLPLCLTAQTPERGPITTLHSSAKLVIVDVVVTDRQHHPIKGLKQSDFALLDNKAPQTISSFEEHTGLTAAQRAAVPAFPKLPPGVFTNYTPVTPDSALNIVLLDTLNTPMTDQAYVRQQLLKFLKDAKPGTNVAIFGLTTRLLLLQSFTSNPEVLRTAVDKGKNIRASALLDDPASGGVTESLSDQFAASGISSAQVVANLANFDAIQQSMQTMMRARYTLDAFNQLARYLTGLPGRKNLIWFSGSFPLDILPDGDLSDLGGDPFAGMADAEDEYRDTTNLLARSQVAVYPIDARGLFNNPIYSASNSGAGFSRNPQKFAQANTKFFEKTSGEHSTMMRMAEDTGGEAFINTNGLSQAVAQAIDFGSNYYTLTYTPSNAKWKGEYRNIRVELAQKGYQLAFRHGYYADDPDAPPTKHAESPATAAPTPSSLQKAMTRGAPSSAQIIFKALVRPTTGTTENAVAEYNEANPNPKIAKGPYRRYTVSYAADPTMIQFDHAKDGLYHADLDFVVFVYDADGQLIVTTSRGASTHLTEAQYQNLVHGGLKITQEISVPVKGEYFLRIGIHDMATDHIGSVEIPVAAVKNLSPLDASAITPR